MVRPAARLADGAVAPLSERDGVSAAGVLRGFEEAPREQGVGGGEEPRDPLGAVEAVGPGRGRDDRVALRGGVEQERRQGGVGVEVAGGECPGGGVEGGTGQGLEDARYDGEFGGGVGGQERAELGDGVHCCVELCFRASALGGASGLDEGGEEGRCLGDVFCWGVEGAWCEVRRRPLERVASWELGIRGNEEADARHGVVDPGEVLRDLLG